MKPLRWTSHALAALVDRGIDRAAAEQAIGTPEFSVIDPPRRVVLMRRYVDADLGRQMLLRVVVERLPRVPVLRLPTFLLDFSTPRLLDWMNGWLSRFTRHRGSQSI